MIAENMMRSKHGSFIVVFADVAVAAEPLWLVVCSVLATESRTLWTIRTPLHNFGEIT